MGEQRNYSEKVASLIDEEIRDFVSQGYHTARRVLTERRSAMDRIVEKLKVEETLNAAQLDEILKQDHTPNAKVVS